MVSMGKRSDKRARWAETTAREEAKRETQYKPEKSASLSKEEIHELNLWVQAFVFREKRDPTMEEAKDHIRENRLAYLKKNSPREYHELMMFLGKR
jgi:hypothetical protein